MVNSCKFPTCLTQNEQSPLNKAVDLQLGASFLAPHGNNLGRMQALSISTLWRQEASIKRACIDKQNIAKLSSEGLHGSLGVMGRWTQKKWFGYLTMQQFLRSQHLYISWKSSRTAVLIRLINTCYTSSSLNSILGRYVHISSIISIAPSDTHGRSGNILDVTPTKKNSNYIQLWTSSTQKQQWAIHAKTS